MFDTVHLTYYILIYGYRYIITYIAFTYSYICTYIYIYTLFLNVANKKTCTYILPP